MNEKRHRNMCCSPDSSLACRSKWKIPPCSHKCRPNTELLRYIRWYLDMFGCQTEILRDRHKYKIPFCWCIHPSRKDLSGIRRYLREKKLKIVSSMARWIRLEFNYHRSRWRSLRSQRGIDNDRIRVNWDRSQLRRKFANEFQRIHQYPDMLSNLRPKRSLQDKCTCNCWERWHRCASIRHCRRRTRQYLKMNFKWTDSSQYI